MKVLLIVCGTIAVLLIAIIGAVGILLSPGKEGGEVRAYHPFRSAEAKEKYLSHYDIRAEKWPVLSESRAVDTAYGKTFVRIGGPVGAPPMVLLHGFGGNSLQWIPNIEAFSGSFRTYAVDCIYDNGRSICTRAIESPDDLVNWLDNLFNALELGDRINVIGLSYGGWLATQYTLRFPKRVDKMVLIAPACTVLPLSYEWIARAVLCALPHRYFTKSFLYWLLEDLSKRDKAGRSLIEEQVEESYLALRSFKTKHLVNPTVLSDVEFQSIMIPTLYLVGENEKIYSAHKAIQRLNAVAPQIKTEVIPHAGHDLTVVQAKMINHKILMFLHQP